MQAWWDIDIQSVYDAIGILYLARKSMRDSAGKLARLWGVSRFTIYNWESGRTKPRILPCQAQFIIDYVKQAQHVQRAYELYLQDCAESFPRSLNQQSKTHA